MRIRREINFGCAMAIFVPLAIAFIVGAFYVSGLMFEYTLFTATGKDVHIMLDILGGVVLNGFNLLLFVFSLIYRACGYPVPIFN